MLLFRLAVRGLVRNFRRSLITGTAVTLGLVLVIFSTGGTDGMVNGMIRDGVGSLAGHVVVQGPGWQAEREPQLVVPDTPTATEALARAVPDALIVPRVFLEGLLTSPQSAVGVGVTAVVPELEAQVDLLADKIVSGTYLDDSLLGIVLGETLAESLGVDLGDKVVLMLQGPDAIESRLFRVQGTIRTGVDAIDGFHAQIPLQAAQEMLGLGSDVNQLSAHLPDAGSTDSAAAAIRAAFADEPVEVLSWPEALPELAQYVAKEQTDLLIFFPVLFLMVALGIMNTMFMSVLERTQQFGVLLAIGLSHRQLVLLVLLEALILGAVASAIGWGLGLGLVASLAENGLDLRAMSGGQPVETAGLARELVIYPVVDPVKAALLGVGSTGMTVFAAIWPALSVARLSPVEALRMR